MKSILKALSRVVFYLGIIFLSFWFVMPFVFRILSALIIIIFPGVMSVQTVNSETDSTSLSKENEIRVESKIKDSIRLSSVKDSVVYRDTSRK